MEPKLSFITNEILEKFFVKSLGCVCWKKFHFSFSPPTGGKSPSHRLGIDSLELEKTVWLKLVNGQLSFEECESGGYLMSRSCNGECLCF